MEDPRTKVGMQIGRGLKLYLIGLGIVGVVLIAGAVLWDWGQWGYWVGGFLLFAGPGSMLANRFKVGWQPAVGPCPGCETRLHYVTKKQYLRCVKCESMLEVINKQLTKVDSLSVADKPVFPVPFPKGIGFPNLCVLCGQPSSQQETVKFEKVDKKGGLPGVVTVLETQKIQLQVPVCPEHLGHKALAIDYGEHPTTVDPDSSLSLKFRSLPMLEAYRRHNQSRMPPLENKPSLPHAPKTTRG
jgi:hypothetical protein